MTGVVLCGIEICVDSVQSGLNATLGGADRLELCSALSEGGLTPSIGVVHVLKQQTSTPIFCLVRPRAGDFLYSAAEVEVMKEDIRQLKSVGADGIVTGALQRDGTLSGDVCKQLIEAAHPLPVTLHRAIDVSRDLSEALEHAISLGFSRVLTSGGCSSAETGSDVIASLVKQAGGRISIIAGAGITPENASRIIKSSGARELHASARSHVESRMTYKSSRGTHMGVPNTDEYSWKQADVSTVRQLANMIELCGTR